MRVELASEHLERAAWLALRAAIAAIERLQEFTFTTWTCAAQLPPELKGTGKHTEELFRDVCREALRAHLEEAWPDRVEQRLEAEVTVETAPRGGDVKLLIRSVFVAGRYRKLARGISQTVFHCRGCRGSRHLVDDCTECGGSGRMYKESVADFVCRPLRAMFDGRSASFHGSGREDVDVRMLGDGRAFAVTIQRPKRRDGDLTEIEAEVARASGGRVTVHDLRYVTRHEVKRLTTEHGEKVYRALVKATTDAPIPADALERLTQLEGVELSQRTPLRVAHRRVDIVRTRHVLDVAASWSDDDLRDLVLELRTEAGTYVKEFISGDGGRTVPSVEEMLGVPVVCAELDVLGVKPPDDSD